MAQLSVTIHGRNYPIVCDDGQEEHVTRLAAYIDKRATEIVPTEFRWLYYLGLITYKITPKEASNTFAKAISINSEYPAAYIYYAHA